jgi:hypothetical protein
MIKNLGVQRPGSGLSVSHTNSPLWETILEHKSKVKNMPHMTDARG